MLILFQPNQIIPNRSVVVFRHLVADLASGNRRPSPGRPKPEAPEQPEGNEKPFAKSCDRLLRHKETCGKNALNWMRPVNVLREYLSFIIAGAASGQLREFLTDVVSRGI